MASVIRAHAADAGTAPTIHPPEQARWAERGILGPVNWALRRILSKMLDVNSRPHGIRSISNSRTASICFQCAGSGIQGRLSSGRIKYRNVWRQFQLAGTDLDAGERYDPQGSPEFLYVLWRQFQNRMPNRLRKDDKPFRSVEGNF
jgi:hypothetical protein